MGRDHKAFNPERHKLKNVRLHPNDNGPMKCHRRRKNKTQETLRAAADMDRMKAAQINFPGMDKGSY